MPPCVTLGQKISTVNRGYFGRGGYFGRISEYFQFSKHKEFLKSGGIDDYMQHHFGWKKWQKHPTLFIWLCLYFNTSKNTLGRVIILALPSSGESYVPKLLLLVLKLLFFYSVCRSLILNTLNTHFRRFLIPKTVWDHFLHLPQGASNFL